MINQDKRPSQKPRKGLFLLGMEPRGCSICTSLSKIDEQLEFTGMQCPSCQHTDSRVLESRAADSGRSVRRRRECLNCDFRFTTYERVETVPITVLKRNGHRETFNRSKLLHGLLRACEKTGLAPASLEVVVDEIEICLQQRAGREVTSNEIGEMVLQQLREMSDVAYVRFASVYRQFKSVGDFVSALEVLGEPTPNRGKTRASLAAVP